MDAAAIVWGVVLLLFVVACATVMRRRRDGRPSITPGAAATGAIYDLLNQDKRNAIELIVEEKAAARDEEHADDIPPDENH